VNANDRLAPDPNRRRRYSPPYSVRQRLLLATNPQAVKIGIQMEIARNLLASLPARLKGQR
jgi:hypothetical protein